MRFAHLSDCHIGSWREPGLKKLMLQAFENAILTSIEREVDFILISGDLFNSSLPNIEHLDFTVKILNDLKERQIPVYMIAGSHDYSPSGKTILDVLENAGLIINVMKGRVEDKKFRLKFTKDKKTDALITGISGRSGMLDKSFYSDLDREALESQEGKKIFMFHIALTELKTPELEKMDSMDTSLLPRGFDYYAGGHVHIVANQSIEGYRNITYPGPIYPVNFRELEQLKAGGFYIFDGKEPEFIKIKLKEVVTISINCSKMNPEKIEESIRKELSRNHLKDAIVLIRLSGKIVDGRLSDIPFRDIFREIYEKGAYHVMRNTTSVLTEELEDIELGSGSDSETEKELIDRFVKSWDQDSLSYDQKKELIEGLFESLSEEKDEDERKDEFESRLLKESNTVLDKVLKG
jgi:hypothetical protein